jgi:xanthine/uracil/vitamin C permease (AzgA family)
LLFLFFLLYFSYFFFFFLGIGNLTAVAGAVKIHLIAKGTVTVVTQGPYDDHMYIALFGTLVIAMLLFYRVRPAFIIVLILNSIITWGYDKSWPTTVAQVHVLLNVYVYSG